MPARIHVNVFICGHLDQKLSYHQKPVIQSLHQAQCRECGRRPSAIQTSFKHDPFRHSLKIIAKHLHCQLLQLAQQAVHHPSSHVKGDIYAVPQYALEAQRAITALEHWVLDYTNPQMPLPTGIHIQVTIEKALESMAALKREIQEKDTERRRRAAQQLIASVLHAWAYTQPQVQQLMATVVQSWAHTQRRQAPPTPHELMHPPVDSQPALHTANAFAYGGSRYAQGSPGSSGQASLHPPWHTHRAQDDASGPPPPYSRFDQNPQPRNVSFGSQQRPRSGVVEARPRGGERAVVGMVDRRPRGVDAF